MTRLMRAGAAAGRPHPALLLLLLPALLAVSLETGRYPVGLLVLVAAVLSYRFSFSIASTYGTRTIVSLLLLGAAYLLAQGTAVFLPSIFPSLLINTCALWLALVAGATWYGMGKVFGPWWLVMITGLLLTLAGNLEPNWLYTVSVWTWILSVLGLLVTANSPLLGRHAGKPAPRGRHTLSLIAALVLASLLYIAFDLLVHRLEIWLTRWIDQGTAQTDTLNDLSAGVDLGSDMPSKLSRRVVLRVTGTRPPEHLRGNVLLTYQKGRWFNTWSHFRPALPVSETWQRSRLAEVFLLDHPLAVTPLGSPPASPEGWWHLRVQSVLPSSGVLFTPAGSRLVALPGGARVDELSIVRKPGAHMVPLYDVVGTSPAVIPVARLTAKEAQLNLAVPPRLHLRLRALATAWTSGAIGTRARAAAIEQYFHRNFEYSLQVKAPAGGDPIVDFLETRRPAYCAYFASGMTLLLRSLGIPAHVVSGYRSADYNRLGRFFVVREREAHGWVEVYDAAAGGWVAYDPTPPGMAAVVGMAPPSRLTLTWEFLGWWFSESWAAFRDADLMGRLALIGRMVDGIVRWPGTWLLLVLAALVRWLQQRSVSSKQAEVLPGPLGAAPAALALLRERLEAALQQHGIAVTVGSTCEDWLALLDAGDLPEDERSRLSRAVQAYRRARFDPTGGAEALDLTRQYIGGLRVPP